MLELDRGDAVSAIRRRWEMGHRTRHFAIAASENGPVHFDFIGGANKLIAGTSGSGKTAAMNVVLASICCNVAPRNLTAILVDYKGGAAWGDAVRLPHVRGLVSGEDEIRMLDGYLRSIVNDRLEMLVGKGHRLGGWESSDLPVIVVAIDETASLALEYRESLLPTLRRIWQVGRQIGVWTIIGTQRPSWLLGQDISLFDQRIALRLIGRGESVAVLGQRGAENLPAVFRGTGLLTNGSDFELVRFPLLDNASCDRLGNLQPRQIFTWADLLGAIETASRSETTH